MSNTDIKIDAPSRFCFVLDSSQTSFSSDRHADLASSFYSFAKKLLTRYGKLLLPGSETAISRSSCNVNEHSPARSNGHTGPPVQLMVQVGSEMPIEARSRSRCHSHSALVHLSPFVCGALWHHAKLAYSNVIQYRYEPGTNTPVRIGCKIKPSFRVILVPEIGDPSCIGNVLAYKCKCSSTINRQQICPCFTTCLPFSMHFDRSGFLHFLSQSLLPPLCNPSWTQLLK